MRSLINYALGAAALVLAGSTAAQPIVYPAKGQSAQQQSKDDGECYVWAKQNTGIDPAVVAQTPAAAPPSQAGGERVRGAARGAIGGAAIGAIAGDTGKGAAIGAVAGTMAGGRQARSNDAARQQQAQAQQQQTINTFYRAYGACMEGRGYTIK
jgi:uncharacterized protein YcfJ